MDDILSKALGRSGLDLGFLEDNHGQEQIYGNLVGNLGSNTNIGDDTDDLSDFLDILGDSNTNQVVHSSDPHYVQDSSAASTDDDTLDMLLKYNSDDDSSRPCSPIVSYTKDISPLAMFQQSQNNLRKVNFTTCCNFSSNTSSLTNCFPKFDKTKKVVKVIKDKNSVLRSNAMNSRMSMFQNKYLLSNNKPSFELPSKSSLDSLVRAAIPNKVKDNQSEKFYSDNISDLDKKRKSIQHVMSSPNLTIREKQNLLKSAITHKMDPSALINPTESTNLRLASLLSSSPRHAMLSSAAATTDDEEDEDDSELIHSDTFSEYWPTKVSVGYRHPDPVVETSSMASVTPPDVWYNLSLPPEVINGKLLSALQLESIIYASQQHEKLLPSGERAGFLIGDGAGVGKGRTVAGIIYENYLHGRKRAIWLSVSNDLRFDAIRDLRDIGCHAKVHPLNKFKYDEKISSKVNGKFKKGVIFATYSSLIGETNGPARFKSRLEQLVNWCGTDFDGVIILDECHKAKNLMPVGSSKPTKTGINVLKLQNQLPKARVVYCSATGASEPKNMAYMNRLGLWGPGTAFREFSDFIQSVEKRGVGAMEMVAMDMKLRGMYIARQLSFAGVTFDVKEVKLCPTFIEMYDASVKLWLDAREKFETAAELVGLDSKGRKTMWGQFWSGHQRFFKYLCIAAKVKRAVEIAKEAVDNGKCVIFGLQSTGEARTLDQIDGLCGELNDFISTTKGVFSTLVEKQFPTKVNMNRSSLDMEQRKRKREWRKTQSNGAKRRKREKGVDCMTSSNGVDSSDDDRLNSSKDDLDSTLSDRESGNESENEENNPFAESSSESDDEDAWLKAASDKKKSKPKVSEENKGKSKQEMSQIDPSFSVFAAAGFSLGRQFSWTNPSVNATPGSSEHMKGNRINKTSSTPTGLSQQMDSVNQTLKKSVANSTDIEHCLKLKQSLLDQLEVIAPYLPPNTLDELIDELGGPQHVAEMTGRKGRVVAKNDGSFAYEPRSKDDVQLEVLNVAEKKRFMDGEKLIAVISEAASSGISLQADRREKNQRRRVHITLELPWSADKAIQQFGRSHRSNQVSAPEYLFLISELAGEQRFASIVAKRLESLGALTHGDRRATESRDLSRFNFDTKYGRQALDAVYKSVLNMEKPRVPPPKDYKGKFLEDVKKSLIGIGIVHKDEATNSITILDKDYSNISRFMNRILGLTVSLQNALFQYFTETLNAIIREAKRNGRWDEGIVDLGSQGETVVQTDVKSFSCSSVSGNVTTELVTVSVERGLSFARAQNMCQEVVDPYEGFYLTTQLRNGKKTAVLVLKTDIQKENLYTVYRPNVGISSRQETLQEIQRKFTKVHPKDAQFLWDEQYDFSENKCCHEFWRGFCKKRLVNLSCEIGARKRTCYILCGSVLSVWSKVESILSCQSGVSSKMQIIRAKLDNGKKLVGMLIPSNCIDPLIHILMYEKNVEAKYAL